MTKFSLDLKLKIVKEYLKGTSSSKLEQKYNVKNHFSVYNWANRYQRYGIDGLKERNKRIKYDGTFKLKVLDWKYRHHATYSETALNFDISNTGTIANWQKKYNDCGSVGLFGSSIHYDQQTIEHSEIERLKQENDILKDENNRLKEINKLIKNRLSFNGPNIYVEEKNICDANVLALIQDIKREHQDYGYRSVTKALKQAGYSINHKRVLRIMNENKLICKNKSKNTIIKEGSLQ
ncbi:hypothetical protein LCR01_05710 [Companilactobacillus crustorum]|uniref:Transposase n=1 Tax=Companilactobacillus crustorum TaxID=392416 RepID=A0AB34A9V6_9LACO|nr:helix-turn-helix domain-containing protein [Companilactobacillus crustorum]GEO76128.1 hypothetical protein LCR01_05710 [Companilactobacillus crustorum]